VCLASCCPRRVRAGQPPVAEPGSLAVGAAKTREWAAPAAGRGLGSVADSFDDGGGAVPRVGVESAPFAFEVELASAAEVGSDGGARQTLWSALAHNHSEAGYRKALALRESYREELLRKAEAMRREEEARLSRALSAMGELLDVDMDDTDAVKASLDADWVHIRVETAADDADDVTQTKRAVLEHFAVLSDVYRHFCGNSLRGDSSSMQVQEFEHLLAVTAAIDVVRDHRAVVEIFKKVNAGRSEGSGALDEGSMSRFEFIEAVLLAGRHRSRDRRSGVAPPCFDCLREVMASCFIPLHDRLSAGSVRKALKSTDIRRWLLHHHDGLRRVFDFYCKQGSRNSLFAEASVLMDEEEFIIFLEHAGFLPPPGADPHGMGRGGGGKRNLVTRSSVREAFAGVQRDDDGTGVGAGPSPLSGSAPGTAAHLEQLTFHEFIEAVARVGLQRWPDDAVTIERRVAWAFSVACSLEEHMGAPPEEMVEIPDAAAAATRPAAGDRPRSAGGEAAGLADDDAASVDAVTAGLRPSGTPKPRQQTDRKRSSVPVVAPFE